NNKTLCDIIKIKGGEIAGSFNCRGYDTYGPFKLVGGIAKGHPNENDFAEAEDFIKEISYFESSSTEQISALTAPAILRAIFSVFL
ncbi:MAG TPA: hypothetical protein VHO66_06735, partial [Ruminiclostridium sp.]|nr:hypothetical protein [Ruminiclostridium sp.]